MKKIVKYVCMMLVATFALSLVACGGNSEEETNNNVYEKKEYSVVDNLDKIKVTGRSQVCDDGLAVDWSASGIEFNANCKDTITVTITSTEAGKFLVYVDGETRNIMLSQGTKEYNAAVGLAEGEHNIRIVKKSDNAVEGATDILTSISKITMSGEFGEKPADKEYLVEFIGDSITCGLGTVSSTSAETDATVAYAYKVAETLDVDYSLVSVSGIGVAESSDGNDGLVMSDIYSYTNYYRNQTEKYTPDRQADLVVVGLNTNDNGRKPTQAEYNAKATELINQIKAVHGDDVKIVWMSSMMFAAGDCDAYVNQLLSTLGGESAGYYHTSGIPDSSGGHSHPSVDGHDVNADMLVQFIKDNKILSGK